MDKKIRDFVPAVQGGRTSEEQMPLQSLQRQVNRLFDDFFGSFDLRPFTAMGRAGEFTPRVDVRESDKALTVTAELPGMDEKDLDVLLSEDSLTIKGEKRHEKEEKSENYYRMERSYGAFHRVISLPKEIDVKKVEASFTKGILTVNLPKTARAKEKTKKVPIKTGK
ncbi:MAG TPA: Hsp20/alpha crystallin family protein [Syntrophales bacterium]|mgnify:CR=1 FL=1|nr:Hsp20/alpha crystallin family protein [Syntrophales bacterium]HOX94873.1 Hsp20/alpha crystallin family protein [Syntrophales bacterium]HPI56404.1 Hsp20/alpha crystallin family protein [Syntrophales bacterium]HPN24209.1 Hsp20/alpha crystallin family protein [Syntrophales bacterium]HQM28562.1 Hsp20/alpha crystallin family protein [Syntrophales bacterium]